MPELPEAEVRHLPVLAELPEPRPLERRYPRLAALPAPVVAAAGGFLAGVATFVLVRVLRRPRSMPARRRPARLGRRRDKQDVVTSRSFLVDVHLLRR
ncbi:MAG: hypothetical protein WD844_10225 [Thermoleophilaceae bacterium]